MSSVYGIGPLLLVFLAGSAYGAPPAPAPTYETCTQADAYFESSLASTQACESKNDCDHTSAATPASLVALSQMNAVVALPPECVLVSLEAMPKTGPRYAVCSTDRPHITNAHMPRACLSEHYHSYVYSEYVSAMTCVGLDPREMFGLINAESDFQVNVGSSRGAWGVGQLTPVAVTAINALKKIPPLLEKPECAAIKSALVKPIDAHDTCDLITPPDGPARNFIYSAESYLVMKERATAFARRWRAFAGLSPADRDKVIFDLTAYSYNGGPAGVSQALAGYFAAHPGPVRSYKAFAAGLRAYLASSFGDSIAYYASKPDFLASKKIEISTYVSTIRARTARLEKQVGAKCSL